MSFELDKRRREENAVSAERQLMNKMLETLGLVDEKDNEDDPYGGRLIFGLDLTGSRQASLLQARRATASMLEAIKEIGTVAVKLIYYRGDSECRASEWHDDPDVLSASMARLTCQTGYTQIARLLQLALAEKHKVSGVVFIEETICEDDAQMLLGLAERLGKTSIPLYVFHECSDFDHRSLKAQPVFKKMANVSGGVYCEFKPDSGAALRELLRTWQLLRRQEVKA